MFKRFSIIISSVILLGVFLAIASVYIMADISWERNYSVFTESTEKQINYYIDSIISNMNTGIESHAYWSEAIEHLNKGDGEWLSENATTFIVESNLFSTDYILVANEELSFVQESGGHIQSLLLNNGRVLNTIYKNEVNLFYMEINGMDAIVLSSPFKDNNLENPTGVFISISFLTEERENELIKLLPEGLEEVRVVEKSDIEEVEENNKTFIVRRSIFDIEKEILFKFNVEEPYKRFYQQRNYTTIVILVCGSVVILLIVLLVHVIGKQINKLIYAVNRISEGDYNYKVTFKSNNLLADINKLTSSVNKMAGDIQNQIKTIDGYYNDMVDVIINAVEINDAYTSRHNIEVGKYAKIIAEELDFEHIDDLITASKLHDIGKISVPSHILNKPGKLTKEEYEIIKIHPSKGYQIIERLDYFKRIKLGVLYHHEHYDGSGYPDGLKGDEIPLIAQIITIADVYDALTSDRSYRKGLSHQEAVDIIKEESGKIFNPKLVEVFMKRENDFRIMMIENRVRNA